MNYALLTVDIAARLLGLVGLVAIAGFALILVPNVTALQSINAVDGLVVLLTFVKAMEFLLPGRFENAMLRSLGGFNLAIHQLSGALFIAALFYLASRLFDAPPSDRQFITLLVLMAAISGAVLIQLLVFLTGFARKVYARYFHNIGLQTAASVEPIEIRQRDRLDMFCLNVASLPWIALGFLFVFSKTVATPGQIAWEKSHELLLEAAFFGPIALALIVLLIRPPFQLPNGTQTSRPKTVFGGAIMLGAASFVWQMGGQHALIATIGNLVTNHPKAEKTYHISEAELHKRMGLCLTLKPSEADTASVRSCGFSKNQVGSLKEGSTVVFFGELSPYGHTLEQYRIKF